MSGVMLEAVRDMRRLHQVPIPLNASGPPPVILTDALIKLASINLISNSIQSTDAPIRPQAHIA